MKGVIYPLTVRADDPDVSPRRYFHNLLLQLFPFLSRLGETPRDDDDSRTDFFFSQLVKCARHDAGGNNHNCQVDTLGKISGVVDTIQSQDICRFRIQWIYFALETSVDDIFEYLVPELFRVR